MLRLRDISLPRGGQRPFGTFPKIHPFWRCHPSLTPPLLLLHGTTNLMPTSQYQIPFSPSPSKHLPQLPTCHLPTASPTLPTCPIRPKYPLPPASFVLRPVKIPKGWKSSNWNFKRVFLKRFYSTLFGYMCMFIFSHDTYQWILHNCGRATSS